jgi:hypothetical protein
MADTIFTHALAQAAEMQRSTQGLAFALRVPENTLLRWMSGRAQMPLQAFRHLVGVLAEHERKQGGVRSEGDGKEKVSFSVGGVPARCPRCDGEKFDSTLPAPALRMTSTLSCEACKFSIAYGELIAALATLAIQHSRVMFARRKRPAAPAPAVKRPL